MEGILLFFTILEKEKIFELKINEQKNNVFFPFSLIKMITKLKVNELKKIVFFLLNYL